MQNFRKSLTLVLLLMGFMAHSMAQQPIIIKGSFTHESYSKAHLFRIYEGRPYEMATVISDHSGKFGFYFYPDYEGLYLVGTGSEQSPLNNYMFWLKGGDELTLQLGETDYELKGENNTMENVQLHDWFEITKPLLQNSIHLVRGSGWRERDSIPVFDEVKNNAKLWLEQREKTDNKLFEAQINWLVEHDLAFCMASNMFSINSAHFGQLDALDFSLSDMYSHAKDMYDYPWGRLAFFDLVKIKNIEKKSTMEDFAAIVATIPNDTLKGDYVLRELRKCENYEAYSKIATTYQKYFLTQSQKQQDNDIQNSLRKIEVGDSGYNFSYPDPNGHPISFNDFQGKVVVLDIWATWCAPCIAEFPDLRALEEDFQEKDVVFVSVSVDEKKHQDKWKKMIIDEKLGGVQLFASGWSEITKYYNVTGIPRFMVFDHQGRVISIDAPRPSDPKLKEMILHALEKR